VDPSPARIESSFYTRHATLFVKAGAKQSPIADYLPPGEYSLDLIVLHELCHLLFEGWRAHIPAGPDLVPVMITEEEKITWELSRTILDLHSLPPRGKKKDKPHETRPLLRS
jgi:hypothetical protein